MIKRFKKGFTLVELVIVIAVVAVLAAVLIPTFSDMIKKAQNSADLQEARNLFSEALIEDPTITSETLYIKVGEGDKVGYVKFENGQPKEVTDEEGNVIEKGDYTEDSIPESDKYVSGTGVFANIFRNKYLVTICEHTNTQPLPAVEATCTKKGLTEGTRCLDCGKDIVPQQSIPTIEHNYVDGVCSVCSKPEPTEPDETCEHEYTYRENGDMHDVTCSKGCGYTTTEDHNFNDGTTCVCGAKKSGEETDNKCVDGHKEQLIPGEEATCTEDGLTDGRICTVCEKVTQAQTPISAKGHSFGVWVVVEEATDTKDGLQKRTCTSCDHVETQTIPSSTHVHYKNPQMRTVEPTCTTKGYTEYICDCGESKRENFKDPTGHKMEQTVAEKPATCTSNGRTASTKCIVCNTEFNGVETQALGHNYDDNGNCTRCDNKISIVSVIINKTTLYLSINSSETLEANVLPYVATNTTVTWSSSNTNVATVDDNGKVTAIGAGEATITATAGDKTATCTVYVSTDHAHQLGMPINTGLNEDTEGFDDKHTLTCTIANCGYSVTEEHTFNLLSGGQCRCETIKKYTYKCNNSNCNNTFTFTKIQDNATLLISIVNEYGVKQDSCSTHSNPNHVNCSCGGCLIEIEETLCTHNNSEYILTGNTSGASTGYHYIHCNDCNIRFIEKHSIRNGNCTGCHYHGHTYKYEYVNEKEHDQVCIYGCGETNRIDHNPDNKYGPWIKYTEGHVINCTNCEDTVVPHEYNNDGICTVCNYKKPCEHQSVTYKYLNASKHSIICSNSDCESKSNPMSEDHTYENGKCTKCNYCQHLDANKKWQIIDNQTHQRICEACNTIIASSQSHNINGEDGSCSICGFKHEHKLGEFTMDNTSHKKQCTYSVGNIKCSYVESSAHDFGNNDPIYHNEQSHKKACIVCSYEVYENHSVDNNNGQCKECNYCRHNYVWSTTDESHKQSCDYCGQIKLEEQHSFTTYDSNTHNCTTCGYSQNHEFKYIDGNSYDTYHELKCDCGGKQIENHNFEYVNNKDGETHSKTCSVCSKVIANESHTYTNSTDTVCDCGYERCLHQTTKIVQDNESQHKVICGNENCNYEIRSENHNFYNKDGKCVCGKDHDHTIAREAGNNEQHRYYCSASNCNYEFYESHTKDIGQTTNGHREYCKICNKEFSRITHAYNTDYCEVCGYCTHKDKIWVLIENDITMHQQKCTKCNQEIESTAEKHTYNAEGKCSKCENPCCVNISIDLTNNTTDNPDDKTHTVTCTGCDKWTITEEHTIANGKCECGHTQDCDHTKTGQCKTCNAFLVDSGTSYFGHNLFAYFTGNFNGPNPFDGDATFILKESCELKNSNKTESNITIDLNGKTLKLSSGFGINGQVTIKNGNLEISNTINMIANFKKLILENVNITGDASDYICLQSGVQVDIIECELNKSNKSNKKVFKSNGSITNTTINITDCTTFNCSTLANINNPTESLNINISGSTITYSSQLVYLGAATKDLKVNISNSTFINTSTNVTLIKLNTTGNTIKEITIKNSFVQASNGSNTRITHGNFASYISGSNNITGDYVVTIE